MTSVVLLEQLKAFTEKIMADMILPVAMQQGDTEQVYRAPEVYLMRLPDSRAAKKKAPYIIHRVIPLATEQQPGSEERTVVSVRSIFCCYNPDEQEGDLALLNMMERFRVELLKSARWALSERMESPGISSLSIFLPTTSWKAFLMTRNRSPTMPEK